MDFIAQFVFTKLKSVRQSKKKVLFCRKVVEVSRQRKIIIYCGTRKNVKIVSTVQEAFPCTSQFYHAGMNKDQRSGTNWF